jgi:hypothetical protein
MMDSTFPDAFTQTVATRLATLNAALMFLRPTHGTTPVPLNDWLTLTKLVEQWVWRGLTPAPCPQAPDAPAACAAPPIPVPPPTK